MESRIGGRGVVPLASRGETSDVDQRDCRFLDDVSSLLRKRRRCENDEGVFGVDNLMAIGEHERARKIVIVRNEGGVCTVYGLGLRIRIRIERTPAGRGSRDLWDGLWKKGIGARAMV